MVLYWSSHQCLKFDLCLNVKMYIFLLQLVEKMIGFISYQGHLVEKWLKKIGWVSLQMKQMNIQTYLKQVQGIAKDILVKRIYDISM